MSVRIHSDQYCMSVHVLPQVFTFNGSKLQMKHFFMSALCLAFSTVLLNHIKH